MNKTTLLCILDGLGINPEEKGNAVKQANTPTLDRLFATCPHTTLTTFGELVGLPEGQMGNSEVGHLNIGAGRVVEQWLQLITNSLNSTFLDTNPVFKEFQKAIVSARDLHLIGLFSDGGVHSHLKHLFSLLPVLEKSFNFNIYLHLITDGRDTAPDQALEKVKKLEETLKKHPRIKIATISGRFYAMDRDKRWERIEAAYQAIVAGQASGEISRVNSASEYLEKSYQEGITDEFILPAVIEDAGLSADSAVLFWNFRADRMREIVRATCLDDFDEFNRSYTPPLPERVLCFTEYDATFDLPFLFQQEKINNHLGEVVSNTGQKQLRLAETEKYPHVTYFLNGLEEEPLPGESRELSPSPRDVKTYDQKPEMSASLITENCLQAIESGEYGLIVLNFANCDMVGHTGSLPAAIKAVEFVDKCLGLILESLDKHQGQALIIADHGNAERMIKEDGSPYTAHTTFPVPAILFGNQHQLKQLADAKLADVAPTILAMMELEQPSEMTGENLLD